MNAHGTGSIPDSCSEHGHYIILKGAYDLAMENLRLVREEFLKEGKTDFARVEELLFIDAWRKHQKVIDEHLP